jgi:ceramide glucosyltransferase
LTHPFPLALLASLFSGGAEWAWMLVLAALLVRTVLTLQSDSALRQPGRDLYLLPVRDMASFAVLIASFFSTRVVWRGTYFEVDRDGLLRSVQDK